MKRIGFSLAGEGRGHAARVVALSRYLRKHYELVYFCPEPSLDFILKHIPEAVIEPVPALSFVKNGHGIDYLKTLLTTIRTVQTLNQDISHLAMRIRNLNLTAMISDFEPYASWAAAQCDVPVLNLNHPGIILKFLGFSPGAWVAQGVATFMMPPAQKTIICSFYRGDVGPIIRDELHQSIPVAGDYYLVYAKDSSRELMQSVLNRFPRESFKIFPNPDEDFTKSLIGCRGVIAPAGHQLISESLFLGKPVLAIPQAGHFEQRLNARMLQLSGRGQCGRFRTLEKDLTRFLAGIGRDFSPVKGLEQFRFNDDTGRAADIIEEFINEYASNHLARRVRYNWFCSIPEKIEALKTLPSFLFVS